MYFIVISGEAKVDIYTINEITTYNKRESFNSMNNIILHGSRTRYLTSSCSSNLQLYSCHIKKGHSNPDYSFSTSFLIGLSKPCSLLAISGVIASFSFLLLTSIAVIIATIPNEMLARYTVSKDFWYAALPAVVAAARIVGVNPGTDSIAVVLPVTKAFSNSIAAFWFKPDSMTAGTIYAGRFLVTSLMSWLAS